MEQHSPPSLDADFGSLVRSVRRLTIAVWVLVVFVIVSYAAAWVPFLWSFSTPGRHGNSIADVSASLTPSSYPSDFDNDFHVRPPEEQVRRATVILVTRIQREPGKHREVIHEIVKRAPNVRFYYKVGDEFARISHAPAAECNDCQGDGQVALLIGNPAQMAVSYSYENDRIAGMGGMSLAQLRQLAQQRETGS